MPCHHPSDLAVHLGSADDQLMFAPKPPLAPEGWAKDVDTSKVQSTTSTNFFVYCGLAGTVFFVLFFIWVLVT
jgi:hypothetical protein